MTEKAAQAAFVFDRVLLIYRPKQFDLPQHAESIMREHPFASLVSTDGDRFSICYTFAASIDR